MGCYIALIRNLAKYYVIHCFAFGSFTRNNCVNCSADLSSSRFYSAVETISYILAEDIRVQSVTSTIANVLVFLLEFCLRECSHAVVKLIGYQRNRAQASVPSSERVLYARSIFSNENYRRAEYPRAAFFAFRDEPIYAFHDELSISI